MPCQYCCLFYWGVSKSGAFSSYKCSSLAQGGSSLGGTVPGHFQLEKTLGFQWDASLQLPKKCHHRFFGKISHLWRQQLCSTVTSRCFQGEITPRECTGPAWFGSNGSMKPARGGRATASSRTWLAESWLNYFCSLFIGVWWEGKGAYKYPAPAARSKQVWHHLGCLSILTNPIVVCLWKSSISLVSFAPREKI